MHHEQALIAAFVKRSKRDRYREILSNPRLRHKFTSQLAHFKDFDPKFRLSIPSNKLFIDNIAIELQERHSPNIVFAISERRQPGLLTKKNFHVWKLSSKSSDTAWAPYYTAFQDGLPSLRQRMNDSYSNVTIRWKDANTSGLSSAIKMKTVM